MLKIDDKKEIFQRLLVRQIIDGIIPKGAELPSERNMAKQYGISRVTVRNVLAGLVSAGIIIRNSRGRLTVVLAGENIINALCKGNSTRIGIVFKPHRITSIFYMTFFKTLVNALNLHCRTLVFYHDFIQPKVYTDLNVDILLIDCAFDDQQLDNLPKDIPIVIINREHKKLSYIACDNFSGGYEMVKAGITYGHRHIACLTGNNVYPDGEFNMRMKGVEQAYCDYGMDWNDLIKLNIGRPGGFFSTAKYLFENFPHITLLLTLTDAWGIKMLETLLLMNIKIPERISLIGFDDLLTGAFLTPPLTSVHQPFEIMGEKLATIINNWEPKQKLNLHKKISPKIIFRGSVKRLVTL